MELKLEDLQYQQTAIQSVVKVFEGSQTNTFDNACINGFRLNLCTLSLQKIAHNIEGIIKENSLEPSTAKLSSDNDLCIEMETGTGKTLVYIKSIYELYRHYGFTKFIILVPSVAIRQGVFGTFKAFEKQLDNIYGFTISPFEYDSKKLSKVTYFIEEQHPQVMVMTTGAFSSDDRILNRNEREDLFHNLSYTDAIARLRPIIFMDEPQEGMDSGNMVERLKTLTIEQRNERTANNQTEQDKVTFKTLDPLFRIRYSATHKVVKNLLYRLSPYDSYKQGLVKKIEVLTVTEKNDEANLKIELTAIQTGKNDPKAKLKGWKLKAGKFVFEETGWLKVGDNVGEKISNPVYAVYVIERIYQSPSTQKWSITFTNGVEIMQHQKSGNVESVWNLQLEWLLRRHFEKSNILKPKAIKCLSLIFIDKVANYMGNEPIIKNLFAEKYRAIYPEYHDGKIPTKEQIQQSQGYYFAQNSKGEFSDNEGGLKEQKKIYELILQKKEELLSLRNPVEFVFSHSALGVGWDNPNVFNIATLNFAYSDIRKRQEIGRGLRICVNQNGQRVYDLLNEGSTRINQLTVIPNESYESFVNQYQQEIAEVYGNAAAGANIAHTHKGKLQNEVIFKINENGETVDAFKRFWKVAGRKTMFAISINEDKLIQKAIEQINAINIEEYLTEVSSQHIGEMTTKAMIVKQGTAKQYQLQTQFAPIDIVHQLSVNTGLGQVALLKIMSNISNQNLLIKSPLQYLHAAAVIIQNIELEEMVNGLEYHLTGEKFPFQFNDFVRDISTNEFVETPNSGLFEKMLVDNKEEFNFAKAIDNHPDVICFFKFPVWYKVLTPTGDCTPVWGVVMGGNISQKQVVNNSLENEKFFMVTSNKTDKNKCLIKHFKALGIETKTVDELQAIIKMNELNL